MDEMNPYTVHCSGILVTLTHVLTADKCLWAYKPLNWAFNEPGEKEKINEDVSKFLILIGNIIIIMILDTILQKCCA